MANDAAWQAGVDIGSGNKGSKKTPSSTKKMLGDDKTDKDKNDTSGNKKPGGLLGLMGKGASALGKKMGGKKSDKSGNLGAMLTPSAQPSSFHKGGKVKKSGYAKVKKGEVVLTVSQAKKIAKKKTGARKRVASKG